MRVIPALDVIGGRNPSPTPSGSRLTKVRHWTTIATWILNGMKLKVKPVTRSVASTSPMSCDFFWIPTESFAKTIAGIMEKTVFG